MKALTISQPYASLIASGEKFVENRRWETLYRGPLAIHAGKGTQYLDKRELAAYPSGCVVAVAELISCMNIGTLRRIPRHQEIAAYRMTAGELLDHEHTEGPFCWILANVRELITPIPYKGAQGLWDFDERNLTVEEESR